LVRALPEFTVLGALVFMTTPTLAKFRKNDNYICITQIEAPSFGKQPSIVVLCETHPHKPHFLPLPVTDTAACYACTYNPHKN
jgi:hypothetical protein